mgnify:FL=1
MPNIGPVVLSVVGDEFLVPVRIGAVIWEGATTSGDTVELHCPKTLSLLWAARTDVSQTYLGASIPMEGIHAPHGFRLTKISAGRLLVYVREN